MFKLLKKLKLLKEKLKSFHRQTFLPSLNASLGLEMELAQLQEKILTHQASPEDIDREPLLYKKLMDAKLTEESLLRQKSRATWLEKGDSNTTFYHNYAKARRGINTITKLQLSNGSWVESNEEVIGEITAHF